MTDNKTASPQNGKSYTRLLTGVVAIISVTCLGLWGLALFRSGSLPAGTAVQDLSAAPVTANSDTLTCQNLIDQAISISQDHCNRIGPNQVCYGNVTIQAELLPDVEQNFANAGDVVDIQMLQRLSTAPLDLQKNEWGIAVFNIIANLPRSLPGEAVKMVVFGNTTVGNNDVADIQSFYFSSELGQIACDQVPFDGIMITMPDGTGVRLTINGSDLTLMGNASLKAEKNADMDVSLFTGTASITASGQTQYFGAGQKVQVPLGGASGTEPVGPPSQPVSLSRSELQLACTMGGASCQTTEIPTLSALNIQATLNSSLTGTPGTLTPVSTLTPLITPTLAPATATPRPPSNPEPPTAEPDPTKKTPPGLVKKTPKP